MIEGRTSVRYETYRGLSRSALSGAFLLACFVLWAGGAACVGFAALPVPVQPAIGESATGHSAAAESVVPESTVGIAPIEKRAVRLRFTAWANHSRYIPAIRRRFETHGLVESDQASRVLEIMLEERETTPGILRFGNLIGTVASGTLIPFYNQVNYRVSFRSFENGILQSGCRYDLRNHELLGALMIPFSFFWWSTWTLEELLEETVDEYVVKGCGPA